MSTTGPAYARSVTAIRNTMAAYVLAIDDGRSDDVADTFCSDGTICLPGLAPVVGREAIRARFAAQTPQPEARHIVVNTLVTALDGATARAVSDLVVVARSEAGWRVRQVGRYADILRKDDSRWRFETKTLEFA